MNFNETKGGVDVLDRLCGDTNTGRKTRRWPMTFFHSMLNNTHVLCRISPQSQPDRTINVKRSTPIRAPSRFQFMMQLVDELSKPWLTQRLTLRIPASLRSSIQRWLGIVAISVEPPVERTGAAAEAQQGEGSTKIRNYCAFCHYKKRRKTASKFGTCSRAIYGERTRPTRKLGLDACRMIE